MFKRWRQEELKFEATRLGKVRETYLKQYTKRLRAWLKVECLQSPEFNPQ
jgi:hypothetical protein